MYICAYRKVEEYKVSRNGKKYQRKAVKRPIKCPLCPSSTQWLTRHLRQCHALKQEQIDAALTNCDDYRRRTATNRKPRLPCPVAGCYTRVTHVGNHLRRKHRTTALAVRRQARTLQVVCATQSASECSPTPELIPQSPQPSGGARVFATLPALSA